MRPEMNKQMNSIPVGLAEGEKKSMERTDPVAVAICPVCGGGNTRRQGVFRHEHPIFSGCSREICGDCEMVFTAPMPTDADLSNYNASYFATAHGGQPNSPMAQAFFAGIAHLRLAFLRRFLDKHQIGVERVLELGPGPGFFARSWLEQAPQSIYSAFETDSSSHESLLKLGVKLVNAADEVSTDLVVMSHVLEHVPDPIGFIRTATRGLKPGGALFIEVPCRDWEHKALDEPHILFFDKVPMRRLLDDLGFTDIEIAYYGQTIAQLKTESKLHSIWTRARAKLIGWGMIAPFAATPAGMEMLVDPLQRAMVGPYGAHRESIEPAWWLRAVARKR
jgi:SAM-dependent methyltransferase